MTNQEFIEMCYAQGLKLAIYFPRDCEPLWEDVEICELTQQGCKLMFPDAKIVSYKWRELEKAETEEFGYTGD